MGESHRSTKILRIVLVLARSRTSAEAQRFLMMAEKPSARTSANIPDALHRQCSPNNILKALLYCTRMSLYARWP
jgi:hypothetical protein